MRFSAWPISRPIAWNAPPSTPSVIGSSAVLGVSVVTPASSMSITIVPSGSTRAVVPGGRTVVESSCSITAGPGITLPARSALRS